MPPQNHRKENLRFLVDWHVTQTDLAKRLNHQSLSQPIISSILRGKRPFMGSEVQDVEIGLGIPRGWMTRVSLRKAWPLCKRYQQLAPEARQLVDEMLAFVGDLMSTEPASADLRRSREG